MRKIVVAAVASVVGFAPPAGGQTANNGASNVAYTCTITLDDFPETDQAPRVNSTPCAGTADGSGVGLMDFDADGVPDTAVVWATRALVPAEDDCDGAAGIQNFCATVTYTDVCGAAGVIPPQATYSGTIVFHGDTTAPADPGGEDVVADYTASRDGIFVTITFTDVFLDMNENGVQDAGDAAADVPFGASAATATAVPGAGNVCPDAPGNQPLTATVTSGLTPNSN